MSVKQFFLCAVLAMEGCGDNRSADLQQTCPAGERFVVELRTVYATPRKPNGDPWAGVAWSDVGQLVCERLASEVRGRLRDLLNMRLPFAGTLVDSVVGNEFQQAVADVCGAAFNWLHMNLSGPSMYAYGRWMSADHWQVVTTRPDYSSWVSDLRNTTAGGLTRFQASCTSTDSIEIQVMNWHMFVDPDYMGTLRMPVRRVPPGAFCRGWAWLPGQENEGLVGALVKIELPEASPACSGIEFNSLDSITVH